MPSILQDHHWKNVTLKGPQQHDKDAIDYATRVINTTPEMLHGRFNSLHTSITYAVIDIA